MPPMPHFDEEELSAALAERYAVTGTLRDLGSQQDRNYRVCTRTGDYVLKIANPAEDREALRVQCAALRHLAATAPELPLPRVHPGLDGDVVQGIAVGGTELACRLLDFVPGEPIMDSRYLAPSVVARLGELAGRIAAGLAGLETVERERPRLWDLRDAAAVLGTLAPHLPDQDRAQRVLRAARAAAARVEPYADRLRVQTIICTRCTKPYVPPVDCVTLDESVNMAFLVVLEAMTPAERVAFVLHDVFRYSFAEVAEIVGRTPGACRQLASSARRRLRGSRPPGPPAAQRAGVVRAFKRAWEAQDIDALVGLLVPEATATGDGGGIVPAALHPVGGAERIARFFAERAGALSGVTLLERTVNGQPGLVAQLDDVTVSVLAFDVAGDRIERIWAVLNPDKLRPWTAS
ncbi:phosphotransferase [Streptomyces sp. NPDC046915]|uniref:phosphotransferase n=1 Tax=Streptomyces sp. NPDC046915 TaxID=3155257 RepID=UPI0033D8BA41